ncbi:MAG: DNA glycosylase [Candidatus Chlorobium antarcticum]|jgi:N-glycosylase/DNA lyase|nr:DNA glycosylase [Candidatus Chlorobium antarcticum]
MRSNSITIIRGGTVQVEHTLFSGQSFVWNKSNHTPGIYSSVIDGSSVLIQQINPTSFSVTTGANNLYGIPLRRFFERYFSLDIATQMLFDEEFHTRFPELTARLLYLEGLRVLRQDPYETLVTFMCAQGIGMAMIRRQVSMLCRCFGRETKEGVNGIDTPLFSFPAPSDLAGADPELLRGCCNNNSVRAGNIREASRLVALGKLDLQALSDPSLPLSELQAELTALKGIGYKIADCIALFGMGRFDAFPIDTHVEQFLSAWFGIGSHQKGLSQKRYLHLQEKAVDLLGTSLSGYAGHHLFHCWRTTERNMKAF